MVFFEKTATYFKRWKNELSLFWMYVPGAKIHVKYKSKKVIILRLDMIGDCTMFTSTAKALREHYADSEMTMVCMEACRAVYERLGVFDRIITFDFKPHEIDYKKLKNLIRELRVERYDILLQPQASKMPFADILAAAIKCNRRIAIETKLGNSPGKWVNMVNFLYDEFIPYPRGNVSEFDYYGAFARGICGPDFRTTKPHLNYEKQHFLEGRYAVLFPGGTHRQKFWSAAHYAKIADHIYEETGFLIVLLGVPSESWVMESIRKNVKSQTAMSVIDLLGRTSVADMIDIIGNAELVVSNDTSGVHIACATNTPSVAIAGGWHYKRFLPYHIENVMPGDHLPLVAYTEMSCYYCDWNWDNIEKVNAKCLERMKIGETSECIDRVTYEQVEKLVDQVLQDCVYES